MSRFKPVVLLLAVPAFAVGQAPDPKLEFFEKRIRPILSENCYNCHAADTKAAGGLRVDDLNGLLLGGDAGPAMVRGDVEKSLLLQRVNHADVKRRMPRDSDALTESEIADLTKWIADGAAWPEEKIPSYIGKDRSKYEGLRKSHWAWQPLSKPAVPEVSEKAWPVDAIDRFVLAKLESKNLKPVADATPEVLLRRVTFDLTGLPPSVEEVERLLKIPRRKLMRKPWIAFWHRVPSGSAGAGTGWTSPATASPRVLHGTFPIRMRGSTGTT